MDQLNATTLTDWTYPAAESTSSAKDSQTDAGASDPSVSFQKLLGQKNAKKAESDGGKQETGSQAKTAEKDDSRQELCQAVAASLAALSNPAAPIVIQSQTVVPEQSAAVETVSAAALPGAELPVETGKSALLQTALQQNQTQTESTPAEQGLAQSQVQIPGTEENQTDSASPKLVTQTAAGQTPTVTAGVQTESATLKQGQSGQQEQDGEAQMQSGQTASAQTLFHNVETAPVKVGDPQLESTQAQDQTGELANQITKALGQGEQRVEMHLVPENLGSVVVDLTWKQDGSLHVALHTSTARAAALLTEHADELGGMLQSNTQSNVQVEVQQQTQSQQFQQNGQNEQNAQQQQQHSQQEHRQQQSETFLQQLRLGLVSMEEELSG